MSSSGTQHVDQVKSVTTLHNGKVIEKPILEPYEKDDELIFKAKEMVELEHCKEKTNSPPILPFPHAMTNIPLLDAIKYVPSYTKFLKDLCTVKSKLNVKKKAFLAEQVSAIL